MQSSNLNCFTFVQPFGRRGIGRHSPVASGTEAGTAHFRSVGQAGALELLSEETSAECCEPVEYGFFVVKSDRFVYSLNIVVLLCSAESMTGQEENLRRLESVAQEVVEEEVVEFVGADKVFGLLLDIPFGVGGGEFWTDGRVDDVEQNGLSVSCKEGEC